MKKTRALQWNETNRSDTGREEPAGWKLLTLPRLRANSFIRISISHNRWNDVGSLVLSLDIDDTFWIRCVTYFLSSGVVPPLLKFKSSSIPSSLPWFSSIVFLKGKQSLYNIQYRPLLRATEIRLKKFENFEHYLPTDTLILIWTLSTVNTSFAIESVILKMFSSNSVDITLLSMKKISIRYNVEITLCYHVEFTNVV